MKFTIIGNPPSDNHLYGLMATKTRRVVKFMKPEGREFKKMVQKALFGMKPTDEAVIMTIHLFFKDKRRRDVHGSLKVLMDAFEGYIYKDDNQVIEFTARKTIDRENPRVEVEFNTVGELYGN